MKRIFALLLATMALLLVSCDTTADPPATDPVITEAPRTELPATAAPVTEPPVTEPPVTELSITEPLTTTPPETEPAETEPATTEPKTTIPVVEIFTADNQPILSKTDYVQGTMLIDGQRYPMKIRGRGNASWHQFEKKAYRIKLDDGESLFGLPKDKDWVLVSSHPDKTLIRNSVAHAIAASLDGLEYTPTHVLINLYINGDYRGVYTIADKIEANSDKLDFSRKEGDTPSPFGGLDIGFLCEIGWDFDGENVYNKDYFDAEKVLRIYVKEPEIPVPNTPELTYTREYIYAMERAILEGNGWQDYIDIDSWVDWFIVTELTFNTESAFYRSCYLWKREGGKLMMGPVWDFDMAFGNHMGDLSGYDGWCTTESTYVYIMENWMNYLLTYEEFTDAVKSRWAEKKDELLAVALDAVDYYSASLEGSWQQNFERWDVLGRYVGVGAVNPYIYDTYEKQVQYLRDFIDQRWAYMDERITNGDITPHRPVVNLPEETEMAATENVESETE
ncbi:MAG: hypothetical protein E7627_03075 [Ruminococcaceae bacterium]|nr:hypothetical protein [Oscillospiraceae bacterium]